MIVVGQRCPRRKRYDKDSLRPLLRARRLRRGDGRGPERHREQRDDSRRPDDSGKPRAPRRLGLGRRLRRRRRAPHPNARRFPSRGVRRRAATARAIRPRALDGTQGWRRGRDPGRHRPGTRARRSRVARVAQRARRLNRAREDLAGLGTALRPTTHRSTTVRSGAGPRARALLRPQGHRALDRHLRLVLFDQRADLQRDVDVASAAPVLPGPARPAPHVGHRRGAQSLLDQRPAALGPRPAVSLYRAQRRDQHRPGQSQLDDRA